MQRRRTWRAAIGLAVAITALYVISVSRMLGQNTQSSATSATTAPATSAPASTGDAGSPLPTLPGSSDPFSAPNSDSQSLIPPRPGFGSAGRGFGNRSSDPLFPSGAGTSAPRGGYSAAGNGPGSGSGTGSFDWTRLFDDALRSGFQFAVPRLSSAAGGVRPMAGGGSLVNLGDGLLRSAGAASSGVVGSSLDLLSEAAQAERRGLNLTLNEPVKNSAMGVRFSFQEAMGHNSLLGGGANSFGSAKSFGSMNSFGGVGANGLYGSGNGLGSGFGSGGKRGGSGASSQVSVQFKF